ncbi:MAG: protein translocase SEC61 complex subunit gamma [Candidatus Methanomethylicota archaeon]|jgi:protein translocase SEC61 complex gamma subunit|uniref:Protein translocase subunit SecE n=1 Tax=Thermoproteota archaeon TaxID=2056631 RepID=A0A520KFJ7_9CREN|nr:MAG: protein translocase SEC61 complex subunit gamma [Candidatus Verstraetearchaeota archaeon]TDA40180.1 MAG: protein translocase SEC61 complex subunit gamma [Candidatus Verstraetearchaeota archaeon]
MERSEILRSIMRILRLSRKPDLEEFRLSLRICLLGIGIVGVFAFIIQLISTLIIGFGG